MRTTKKRIRRIVTGMICLLLMFTLTGCQIKIDIPGLGQIRLGDSKEEKEDAESKKQKKTKKPDSGKKPETTDTDKPISPRGVSCESTKEYGWHITAICSSIPGIC